MSSDHSLDWIEEEMASLRCNGLLRRRVVRHGAQRAEVTMEGKEYLHFASNDYLDLAADSQVVAAVVEATKRFGWGSGASPLISGYSEPFLSLERRLAEFEGTEAAIVFPTGYAANMGAIAALVGPGDVVFTDRMNHASLFDGCRLSRADVRAYPHNDWQQLDALLTRRGSSYRRRLIVTDGLFSMEGDLAPLRELAEVAQRHRAMLLVDEAHATGLFGSHGRGVAEHCGVDHLVPIRVGTLGKALGCFGGFVAGSRSLIEWLVNRARPYFYSTAWPAAAAFGVIAALDVLANDPQRGSRLLETANHVRQRLTAQGWDVGNSASQIIPVVVGESDIAMQLASDLRREGLFVPAIRPPTVPQGKACLRISLTSGHTPEMIDMLLAAFERLQ